MALPDPALGISVDFPTEQFNNAIRFAMQMGAHPTEALRPTFVKKATARTYWKNNSELADPPRMDRDGKPLDPDVDVRFADPEEFQVDCAVEVDRADAEELPIGNFRPTKVTTTLLLAQYEQIKECRELAYNGDRYLYGYEPESDGLFDAGVHMIVWYCLEDS